jgi:hypothetical protein
MAAQSRLRAEHKQAPGNDTCRGAGLGASYGTLEGQAVLLRCVACGTCGTSTALEEALKTAPRTLKPVELGSFGRPYACSTLLRRVVGSSAAQRHTGEARTLRRCDVALVPASHGHKDSLPQRPLLQAQPHLSLSLQLKRCLYSQLTALPQWIGWCLSGAAAAAATRSADDVPPGLCQSSLPPALQPLLAEVRQPVVLD